jgi:hypothetical protein
MYPQSSPRERVLAAGTLLLFLGIGGLAFLDFHGNVRIVAGFCLVVGAILNIGSFFVRVWDQNRVIRSVKQNAAGVLWLRILVVALWIGILPLACLWTYKHIR